MRAQCFLLPIVLMLSACDPSQPSHLGNPLLLPGQAISNSVQNAQYNTRRGQVEIFVKTNFDALIVDIDAGGGPTLTQAMDLARVQAPTRPILALRLKSDMAIYRKSPDALVVALMVHGP